MPTMSSVVVLGHMTAPAEMKAFESGKVKASFQIAVNEGKDANRKAIFIGVEAWDKTAKIVTEYGDKGALVLVEGRLAMDTWTDKVTGKPRTKLYVIAHMVHVMKDRAPRREDEQESAADISSDVF